MFLYNNSNCALLIIGILHDNGLTLYIMNIKRRLFSVVLFMFIIVNASCRQSPNLSGLVIFAAGLNKPVCIANAGDNRLFVVGQEGYIFIVDSVGNVSQQPFLDIHERVIYGGERGLLGLAFNPQFSSNGFFYVNYVGLGDSTHISRFSLSPGNHDIADPQSEFKLMTIYQPYENHKGGDLCFGPDGYLYIGLGDGGLSGDPGNRAQDPKELLGKILRIDVGQGNPYSIPQSNPFYISTDTLGEIWALGLRNPWRFSFDKLNGNLWIGDVGQDEFEEIDMQQAASSGGENYGWRCYEGNQSFASGCPPAALFTFPVYTYPHGGDCSVTGGYVYRGAESSPYYGYYFFADYCSDKIWTLHNVSGNWIKEDYGQFSGNGFSSFGEDAEGQLYIAGLVSGILYRVVDNTTYIGNNKNHEEIKIIHFPSSNKVRIETGRNDRQAISIKMIDRDGATLFDRIISEDNYEFDIGTLPAGAYFLNLRSKDLSLVHKLIKAK
jgi:glucose/arabinose dehydrogenase